MILYGTSHALSAGNSLSNSRNSGVYGSTASLNMSYHRTTSTNGDHEED